MTSSAKLAAGAVFGSALFLSACTGAGEQGAPATETVTQTATAESAPAGGTATQSSTTAPADTADRTGGDDPVFAALDAALSEHAGAIVVSVDRDDRDAYDVDVVSGEHVIELEIGGDGTVREDERERDDDDDVREAWTATVTAADAIGQALDQHPDGVLDEIELDEDDGSLHWDIDLDDAQRGDLVELEIPAA